MILLDTNVVSEPLRHATDMRLQVQWHRQKVGTRLTVFLLHPSERDRNYWQVSQAWVDR